MDERTFQQKLAELTRDIDELPTKDQSRIKDLAEQARLRHEKMKSIISSLTESMDYLRLSVKYLIFDLEATRRENRYLRKLLESRGYNGNGGQGIEGGD